MSFARSFAGHVDSESLIYHLCRVPRGSVSVCLQSGCVSVGRADNPALPIFLPIFLNLFAIFILCRLYLQRRQCKAYFYLLIIFPSISVPSAISRARFPVVYSTRRFRLLFLSFRFAYGPTLRALGKQSSIDCPVAIYSEPKIPEFAFAYCLYHLISERICSGG